MLRLVTVSAFLIVSTGTVLAEQPAFNVNVSNTPSVQVVNPSLSVTVANASVPVSGTVVVGNTSPIPVAVTQQTAAPRTVLAWEDHSSMETAGMRTIGIVDVSPFQQIAVFFECNQPIGMQISMAPGGVAPYIPIASDITCGTYRKFDVFFDFLAVEYFYGFTIPSDPVRAYIWGRP